jgi:hypothetical protein
MRKLNSAPILFISLVLVLVSFLAGCSDRQDVAQMTPAPAQQQSFEKLSVADPAVQAVMKVQDRHTPDLFTNPNVVGTATGIGPDGNPAIMVYLKSAPVTGGKDRVVDAVPATVEGVQVITEVTGEFRAMATTAVSHTAKQTPPISLGTSGGWRYDLANGYCCSGTLGALIQKGGVQYILSNYHVFWGDNTLGGNARVATAGDPVIQPGMVDISCNAANAQNVATLSGSGSLPSANVDAGYAQVITGMVRTDGAILEIGTIGATTVSATIGQAVKKSGRTTGLTRSTISGLNATISVQYDTECGGGVAFTKTFTGQIVVKNKGSRFLNSGDSGSLMVQDVTTNPKAVGLLFAGSSTSAIANPIGSVLSWAGNATMVGH